MQYRTHIATSIAITIPIMVIESNINMLMLGAVALGSVIPDIDEPKSYIGRKVPVISHVTKLLARHRGITHSFIGTLLFSIIIKIIGNLGIGNFNMRIGKYIILGYFLHILEDSFSKSGVKWFLPFKNKSYKNKKFYYKTGDIKEMFIFVLSLALIYLELKFFGVDYRLW